MRVAVLFFGEVRGFPELWKRIYERMVAPNSADVFMHNYYYKEDFLEEYNDDSEMKQTLIDYYKNKGLNLYPNPELATIFKPKGQILETRQNFVKGQEDTVDKIITSLGNNKYLQHGRKFIENDFNAIMGQHYSKKTVIQLKCDYEKANNFTYDAVIISRIDINILGLVKVPEPPLSILVKILSPNVSIFEQIIIGRSSDIDALLTMFESAPELYIKHCDTNIYFMQNERFTFMHLKNNDVFVRHMNFPLDYSHNRNGLSRFNKSFVIESDNTQTTQIMFNENKIDVHTPRKKKWRMF
jgi:hypothetical protein